MFKNTKWWLKRIWHGPESRTHGSTQSEVTVLIPNHGGLKRYLVKSCKYISRNIIKLIIFVGSAVLLGAIAFFVPYFLGKWFK